MITSIRRLLQDLAIKIPRKIHVYILIKTTIKYEQSKTQKGKSWMKRKAFENRIFFWNLTNETLVTGLCDRCRLRKSSGKSKKNLFFLYFCTRSSIIFYWILLYCFYPYAQKCLAIGQECECVTSNNDTRKFLLSLKIPDKTKWKKMYMGYNKFFSRFGAHVISVWGFP